MRHECNEIMARKNQTKNVRYFREPWSCIHMDIVYHIEVYNFQMHANFSAKDARIHKQYVDCDGKTECNMKFVEIIVGNDGKGELQTEIIQNEKFFLARFSLFEEFNKSVIINMWLFHFRLTMFGSKL